MMIYYGCKYKSFSFKNGNAGLNYRRSRATIADSSLNWGGSRQRRPLMGRGVGSEGMG